jgi:uncharacterized protein (TIGR02118 family)
MLKVIFFIRRRSDLTREQFKEHYETVHVPLSFAHLPLLRRHARNYVQTVRGQPAPDFDVVTECWFDDWDALKQTSALIAAEKRPLIEADEAKFMDRASIRSYITEEFVTLPPQEEGS